MDQFDALQSIKPGAVLWLTGLPGSGKSTLAEGTRSRFSALRVPCVVVDGDILRNGISRDLGFSAYDRHENVRRAGELAIQNALRGHLAIVALISPFESDRRAVQARCEEFGIPFALVFVDAPLACCEKRDPKGLYKRARNGEISQFTGISSPYDPPQNPTLVLRTDKDAVADCVDKIVTLANVLLTRDTLKSGPR